MSQPDLFVGIDVAKDELVIHLHTTGTLWRVANSKTGLAMLGRKLTRLSGTARLRIGFEASGSYERKLAILLDRLGLTACLLDPARVRSFARAERQLAKPVPSVSRGPIRSMPPSSHDALPRCTPNSRPRPPSHQACRACSSARPRRRPGGSTGQQLESIADTAMRRLIVAQVARLKALALRIEKAIALVIAASPELAARERLLCSAPASG